MRTLCLAVCIGVGALVGCSDDGGGGGESSTKLPYDTNTTTVIGGGGFDNAGTDGGGTTQADGGPAPIAVGSVDVTTPDGSECLDADGIDCVKPQLECKDEDAKADVLVDEDGVVVDVICYPTGGVSIEDFEGDVMGLENGEVLVIDDQDDGADVTGNVTLDGNNILLFGHGPDVSVIDGNLHLDKNNALVRGIRVTGDVLIDKNNPSFVDCVIEGNLTICGNNVSVALCEVWGKTSIGGEACSASTDEQKGGNNAILVANRLLSAPEIFVNGTVCNDNRLFADTDDDKTIDDDEVGDLVSCAAKPDTTKPDKPAK
jgi:hypothetical protein